MSLTEAAPPPSEIIVVADGDPDAVSLGDEFGVRVPSMPGPQGPAKARNLGANVAQGDLLLFIDADAVVSPDIVERVTAVFEQDPDLTAIIGSYDDQPAEMNFLSQYKNLLHHYVHQTSSEEASTFWGACGAIRREVFLSMGGFDERYRHPAIEDIELGYRLKLTGHRIRLCKSLQVKHLKHWGVISLLKSDIFYRAIPWTELILRYHYFINDLNLKHSSRASVVLTYGLLLSLVGTIWWPASLVPAIAIASALLVLNVQLYRFFKRKRGLWFAIRVVLWHWLYYFYSGLSFAFGLAHYLLRPSKSRSETAVSPSLGSHLGNQ